MTWHPRGGRREHDIDFVPKTRIEISPSDDMAGPVIEAIRVTALTADVGDGKIAVLPVEDAD